MSTDNADLPEARAATVAFAADLATMPTTNASEGEPVAPVEGRELYALADGRNFVVPPPPHAAFAKADEFTRPVRAVVETLQSFAMEAEAVARDRMLSDEGREHRLAPKAAQAVQDLVTAHNTLTKRADAVTAKRAELFKLPELKPNDAVGQLADSEARQWWRGLTADERAAMMPKLSAGEHPRLAVAMMRSPWPMGDDSKLATQGWNTHIEREYVGELIDLDGQASMLDWSRSVIGRAAQKLVETRGLSPGRVGAILRDKQADGAGPFKVPVPRR